jgi:hypothetical protein
MKSINLKIQEIIKILFFFKWLFRALASFDEKTLMCSVGQSGGPLEVIITIVY